MVARLYVTLKVFVTVALLELCFAKDTPNTCGIMGVCHVDESLSLSQYE
jgi:hypothetical protein